MLNRQNSETEYLIDPESSVGMLILKPTNQYSSNANTSNQVTKAPQSPMMQIHDYQANSHADENEESQKGNIVSGFYHSSKLAKRQTLSQNNSSCNVAEIDPELKIIGSHHHTQHLIKH